MSLLTIPSSTPALPAPTVHPHGHGHKKGGDLLTDLNTDSTTGSTAAQVPPGSAQSLFGTAFSALKQLIGLQPLPVAASPAAAPNAASSASGAAAGSKVNLMA